MVKRDLLNESDAYFGSGVAIYTINGSSWSRFCEGEDFDSETFMKLVRRRGVSDSHGCEDEKRDILKKSGYDLVNAGWERPIPIEKANDETVGAIFGRRYRELLAEGEDFDPETFARLVRERGIDDSYGYEDEKREILRQSGYDFVNISGGRQISIGKVRDKTAGAIFRRKYQELIGR